MPRMLLVVQDKGGVGKSSVARSLADALPAAPVIEIDASQRLLELGERVWLAAELAKPAMSEEKSSDQSNIQDVIRHINLEHIQGLLKKD